MKRRDVIAQAQSGTGKTATFSIALLQSIDTTVRETQVLCLSPTRELATQIQKVKMRFSDKGAFNNYVDKMRVKGVKKYPFLSTLMV